MLTGSVMALPEETHRADCIILSAVLEHLRNVRAALAVVRGALAPGGLLYVEVPDLEHFPEQLVPTFQEFSVEHINFFTAAALRNVAAKSGFEMTEHWRTVNRVGPSMATSICALFRPAMPYAGPVAVDRSGAVALRRYVKACADCESKVAQRIAELVEAGTPLIVWGVGTHTLHLLEEHVARRGKHRGDGGREPPAARPAGGGQIGDGTSERRH